MNCGLLSVTAKCGKGDPKKTREAAGSNKNIYFSQDFLPKLSGWREVNPHTPTGS
jgi:hypothetical protein